MIDYEVYKVLHVLTVILFLTSAAVSFSHSTKVKWASILGGIATFLILVSGMGLIARLGIGHGEPWPMWIKTKVAVWLVLAIGVPVVSKRFLKVKKFGYLIMMVFAFIAIYSAVYKFGA